MLDYELEYYNNGITLIAGVDEAGRGPLAGPVCVAACIMPMEKDKIIVLHENQELLHEVYKVSSYDYYDARVSWLRDFASYANETKLEGAVAECGVNRGDFSMYINEYFPHKHLYLFDTFEGFSEIDLSIERAFQEQDFLNSRFNDDNIFEDSNA